ncbi:hypothetical protein [Novosphingobium sp. 9U]|uniref:hypothetical protein n=1 Tax=Novosphingobium sp. 9U TaxID=2653158 RepID=UPI00135A2854|nr:hypothetical protein [Novosphingobium sp. 9U]
MSAVAIEPALIRVRELPNEAGYEVERYGVLGRRAIGFRLHACDANQLAREHHAIDQLFHVDGAMPAPILQLWEPCA